MTIINCKNGTVEVSSLFVKYSNVFQNLIVDIPDDDSESLPLNNFSREDVLTLNKLINKFDNLYIEEPDIHKDKSYFYEIASMKWRNLGLNYEVSPDAEFSGVRIYNPNTSIPMYSNISKQNLLNYIETKFDNFITNICKHDGYVPYANVIREEIIDHYEVSQIIDIFKLVNFLDMPIIENALAFLIGIILRYESYKNNIYIFDIFKSIRLKLNHITNINHRKSKLRNNPWYNFDSILNILNKTHLNIINYTGSLVFTNNRTIRKIYYNFDNNNLFNTMEYWDITDITDLEAVFKYNEGIYGTPYSKKRILLPKKYCGITDIIFLDDASKYNEGIYVTTDSYKKRILLSNKNCLLWNTSNVKYMNSLFEGTHFNGELPLHTSNVITMNRMFCNCKYFDKKLNWDTSNVRNMSEMFMGCISLNQVLKFKTHNLILMSSIFRDCKSFNQPLNWDTSNVGSLECALEGCCSFNQPLKWNTVNVINLNSTFKYCSDFNQPLNWNTKKVKNMDSTFSNCKSFNQPLNWNTENVISMKCTFSSCYEFNQQLKWNTKNVKTMSRMFEYAKNFDKKLYWNTKNVCNFNKMFVNTKVTSVNQLDTSSVTRKYNMLCF